MQENIQDNTASNPMLGDVAEVEEMNQFLDEFDEREGDSEQPPKKEKPSNADNSDTDATKEKAEEAERSSSQEHDEFNLEEDEEPDWGESGDNHIDATAYEDVKMPIAKAIVDGGDFLLQEIIYRRVKIPERDYLTLETDPKYPPQLREAFRTAGFHKSVTDTNVSIKSMLGIEEEDKEELARLGTIIVEKHVGEVNVGPEGQFLMVLTKVGYQHWHIINNEIPDLKKKVKGEVDDGVERVKKMFEQQNKEANAS